LAPQAQGSPKGFGFTRGGCCAQNLTKTLSGEPAGDTVCFLLILFSNQLTGAELQVMTPIIYQFSILDIHLAVSDDVELHLPPLICQI